VSSKYLIARLLSGRNRLTRWEKDVIFARVMGKTAPRRTMRWPTLALGLAGAAAAFVLLPWGLRGHERAAEDGFASRGGASAAGLGLVCSGQPSSICRLGQTLMFDLQDSHYRYFAAFARRDDGRVIWYFPEAPTGRSVDLRERSSAGVLDRGISLDATHGAGRYQVYGIYSAAPLSRDDIKARFQPGSGDLGPETSVATRELLVP
jgi:hypothetical protein